MWFLAIPFALLGLIIGSFLNVLILRHNTGRGIRGRSACFSCGTTLQWFELVPLVSYVFLRGRCRSCGSAISIQYPLVEVLTAGAFVLIGTSTLPQLLQVAALLIASTLILIAMYDLRHTIIPDAWVYTFIVAALVYRVIDVGFASSVAILLGACVAVPLLFLWFISRGAWMGFGDVKLAIGLGLVLGFMDGITALLLAFVLGALIGVFILLPLPRIARFANRLGITGLGGSARAFTMKSEVPFGPFLILGFSIIWFSILHGIALPPLFVGLL